MIFNLLHRGRILFVGVNLYYSAIIWSNNRFVAMCFIYCSRFHEVLDYNKNCEGDTLTLIKFYARLTWWTIKSNKPLIWKILNLEQSQTYIKIQVTSRETIKTTGKYYPFLFQLIVQSLFIIIKMWHQRYNGTQNIWLTITKKIQLRLQNYTTRTLNTTRNIVLRNYWLMMA